MTDSLKELPKLTDWWPEEWRTRLGRISSSLVASGWDSEDAAREAERVCRGEFSREENRKARDRAGEGRDR